MSPASPRPDLLAESPGSLAGDHRPATGTASRWILSDRRFNLGDGMIVVAAAAVALVLARPFVASAAQPLPLWGVALAWVIAGVVAATPALLILRFRSPRPSL